MGYKLIVTTGVWKEEMSSQDIDDCIKSHYLRNDIGFTDYLYDDLGNICGLKCLADRGHGYGFDYGKEEFTIKIGETYSFEHSYTSIEGPSDWYTGSYKVILQLVE